MQIVNYLQNLKKVLKSGIYIVKTTPLPAFAHRNQRFYCAEGFRRYDNADKIEKRRRAKLPAAAENYLSCYKVNETHLILSFKKCRD